MTTAETTSPSLDALAGSPPSHAPARRLAGKVCLVVGATSGIGRATALRMAEEGAAAVVVSGRRQALGQDLAEALCRMGSESVFVTADVTCEADLSGLVERTMTRFGRLDAAFNNAGFQERRAPLAVQTDDISMVRDYLARWPGKSATDTGPTTSTVPRMRGDEPTSTWSLSRPAVRTPRLAWTGQRAARDPCSRGTGP